jgi:hypothetical protein
MDDGKFTKVKKFLAFVTGVGVLWASIIFSKNGFNFNTSSDYIWVGWVLAFAATTTQLIMNSSFKKINWTILLLGLGSYIYSIYTNMLGFHSLRATESIWDILNVCGSFFMDVFPEVAISWALDESKVGDLIGNLLKSAQTPEMLTKTQDVEKRVSSGFNNSGQSQNNNRQTTSQDITSRLPKNKENNNGGRNQGERKQREMYLPYTDAELEYMKPRNPNKDDGSERKSEYRA